MIKVPATITYASVVSRETERIALMIATHNDLEVKSGNILNAHVAPVTEEVSKITYFGQCLSRSFKNGGGFTELLNQFDD